MNNYDFECFKKEFILLSELNHPNIVHVFDFKEDESAVYLIMEYLNGESLTMEMERMYKETGSRVYDEEDAKDILVK
jgi:serine/threonine protein kinase